MEFTEVKTHGYTFIIKMTNFIENHLGNNTIQPALTEELKN